MIEETIKAEVEKAIELAGYQVPVDFSCEKPPQKEMGDYATNIAMIIAAANKALIPKEVAEKIKSKLVKSDIIKNVEVAGAGFINIFVKDSLYFDQIKQILEKGENYGKTDIGKGKKVNVEYISANPTGPLHIGNARGGPIGEATANLYDFLGYKVTREFYINDVGGQINHLAESLLYYYEVKHDQRIVFPEGGYPGDYVKDISAQVQIEKAKELAEMKDRDELLELFKKEGLAILIRKIKEDCALLDIEFDKWTYQSDIEFSGKTDLVVKELEEKGLTTKREGALWFKNPDDPEFEDKESVLKKSDGKEALTYFADDIAYHKEKFDLGDEIIVDVWGANHHGHIPRIKSAMEAMGYPAENFIILLYQYIRLKHGDEVMKMGKRFGNIVTLRQVIEAGVAPDVFKYFILSQNSNTPFDFDIKLAADTSEKNPVFYMKYAHARICSILEKYRQDSKSERDSEKTADMLTSLLADLLKSDLSLLKNEKEIALYKELIKFPEILLEIKKDFQIQTLPHFAYQIAGLFHDFYTNCQVLSDDLELTKARLALIMASKNVIANALKILDIEAPEKM